MMEGDAYHPFSCKRMEREGGKRKREKRKPEAPGLFNKVRSAAFELQQSEGTHPPPVKKKLAGFSNPAREKRMGHPP
jgi:hypothetical protein